MAALKRLSVGTASPYEVLIGPGLLDEAGRLAAGVHRPCRTAVITDDTVAALYGERVMDSLRSAGFSPVIWSFPHGEASKNMWTLEEGLRWLAGCALTRTDLIVALGGGVPGDLAGFAAAVYCRGMDFLQIPTTLLAAVDSSVGGKTAVDLPEGKNMVGAFHQPALVLCDTDVLAALPPELIRDGSAEMLKYGMLVDPELFDAMADGSWKGRIAETVARCVAIKRDYVQQDETDRGVRQFLNLGHTFGHAAELLSGFSLTHGQGVGMGLMMAARAAGAEEERVRQALEACGLESEVPFSAPALAGAALADKKRRGDRITLVLPERIGRCRLESVEVAELPGWFEKAVGEGKTESDKAAGSGRQGKDGTVELDLKEIRTRLDEIDEKMVDLFTERMRTVQDVAAYKKEHGLPILDTGREREIMNRVTLQAGEDLEHATKLLYQMLFSLSRTSQAERLGGGTGLTDTLENAVRNIQPQFPSRALVACQGTEGAYSQQACMRMFEYPDILYMNTFNDVFNAVEKGMCPYGVLPIENSTAGSVTQVYDLMEKHHFHIVRAVRQRVEHRLLALPGAQLSGIREIVSHEQALRQCSAFLAAHPDIKATAMENTAVAAAYVASSGRSDLAAIASQASGALYGLQTLESSVSDAGNNFTRFICIAKDLMLYEGADKISLMLSAAHRPGSLYRLLSHIAVAEANLTKLESRPIPGKDFEFRFFFDIEASIARQSTRRLLEALSHDADQFVFLGNYEEIR